MAANSGAAIFSLFANDRRALASYYGTSVAPWLLLFLEDRAACYSLADGVEFAPAPELLLPTDLENLALRGAVELRAANAQTTAPQRPDWLALSFRPGVETGWNLYATAEATQLLLTELGFEFFWKVSGNGGLHLLLSLRPGPGSNAVSDFARMLASLIASRVPDAASTRLHKHSRRVYIDTSANHRDGLLLAPFSARAVLPPRISLPLAWSRLGEALLNNGSAPEFDLNTPPELLAESGILLQRALLNPNDLEGGFIALETALQTAL